MTHPEINDEDVRKLVQRVREATGALMQGDVRRYFALVNEAPDYTLMSPTGGPTRHGSDTSPASVEALEKFFAGGGDGDLELEQSYASGDLVVLVGVERQHGSVGGLPDQDWPLRVTLARSPTGAWCTGTPTLWCIRSAWSSSPSSPAAWSSPARPSFCPRREASICSWRALMRAGPRRRRRASGSSCRRWVRTWLGTLGRRRSRSWDP